MGTATLTWARRATGGLAALACAGALGSCTVPKPPGDGPLRYRDKVFTTTTVTRDLQYASAPDAQGNPVALTLDLYEPANDTRAGRPAIVWIHGGGFQNGTKENPRLVRLADEFARRGYVAVSINYRLLATQGCEGHGTGTQTPECEAAVRAAKADAQAAVRWLRANAATYRIDPTRIAAGGGSAGAVTALLVGAFSEEVGGGGNPGFSSKVGGVVSVSGALPAQFDDLFGAGDVPSILFVGTVDDFDPARVLAIAGRLYNAGVTTSAQVLDGAGHVPVDDTYGPVVFRQSAWFLYWVLDLAHAQGQPPEAARAAEAMAERLRGR